MGVWRGFLALDQWENGCWENHADVNFLTTLRIDDRCSIAERLRVKCADIGTDTLAIFYCDGNNAEKRDSRHILGSILRQLILSSSIEPDGPQFKHLQQLRQTCQNKSKMIPELLAAIKLIASSFNSVMLVVDGLDECSNPSEVCEALKDMAGPNIRILTSSRWERDIADIFCEHPRMELEDSLLQADIEVYIDWRLANEARLRKIKPSLKEEIRNSLTSQSSGIFRWVQCQLDYLGTFDRDSKRREALKSLPPGLLETYKTALDRLAPTPDRLEVALKALTWIMFAVYPLSLHALSLAAVIEPDYDYDDEQKLDTDEMILDYCGSFVRLNIHSNVVEISHISVRQFLVAKKLPNSSPNPYYIDIVDGHCLLLRSCLNFLISTSFLSNDIITVFFFSNPLWHDFGVYALHRWPVHGRVVEMSNVHGQAAMINFMMSPKFCHWALSWECSRTLGRSNLYFLNRHLDLIAFVRGQSPSDYLNLLLTPGSPGPLYCASFLGLPSVANQLLELGADVNEIGGYYERPIFAAARGGHREVVRLLLDWKADVDCKDRETHNLFFFALRNRWYDLAEDLKSSGMSTEDPMYGFPLHIAVEFSEIDANLIANPLFEGSINQKRQIDGSTPLHVASRSSRADCLENALVLITAGAELDATDNKLKTPLHYAAETGHIGLLSMLFDKGANSFLLDSLGHTPFHGALRYGQLKVARWLDMKRCRSSAQCASETHFPEQLEEGALVLGEIQRWAQQYPQDYVLQAIYGFWCLYSGDTAMAQSALDMSIELNPRNISVSDVDNLENTAWCSRCATFVPIRGIRYIYKVEDVHDNLNEWNFCSGCAQNFPSGSDSLISVPSKKWLDARFPDRIVAANVSIKNEVETVKYE